MHDIVIRAHYRRWDSRSAFTGDIAIADGRITEVGGKRDRPGA